MPLAQIGRAPEIGGSSKATPVHNVLWEENNVFASNVSQPLRDRNSRTRRMPELGDVTKSEFPQFSVLSENGTNLKWP